MSNSLFSRRRKSNALKSFQWGLLTLLATLVVLLTPARGFSQSAPSYGLRVLSSNFQNLPGISVDTHGNVYAVDETLQLVEEFVAVNGVVSSSTTPRLLGSGYNNPRSVAVDTAGDVFVANYGSIVELMAVNGSVPDSPTIVTVATLQGTAQFNFMSLDGFGNLVVVAESDTSSDVLQLMAVNGVIPANPTIRTLFSTMPGYLGQITSDSRGNVYFLYFDLSTINIDELTAVNGMVPDGATPQPVLLQPDPSVFAGFAVDAAGNIFISEIVSAETCALLKVSAVNGVIPSNPTFTTLYSAPQATFRAQEVALDANDDLFISDFFDNTGVGQNDQTWELAEVAPTAVALTPSTFDYASVNVGSNSSQTFTLANTGTAAVNIASTSLASQVFTISSTTCTAELAAASSCTYEIEFAPATAGAQMATFTVTDDGGTQTAALTGTGLAVTPPAAPAAALTPATEDFGSVSVSSSAARTFTLTNAGTAPLPITSFALTGAGASSFAIGKNTCGSSLAAGASCTVSISFNPTAAGSDTASFTVVDTVGTQTSALSGAGAAVLVPDFAIAATPPSQTVAAGSTASYGVAITPSNGFESAVVLTATGLPPGATVTFTPASVTPGSAAASSTMAIQTSSQQAASENNLFRVAAPALAVVFLFLPFRRLRNWRGRLCTLLLVTLTVMSGCGRGSGPRTPSKTSATYTVTVTGTNATLTHSNTVQITVTDQ